MRPQGSADHAQEGAICLTVERSQSEQWSARKVQSASQLYLYETFTPDKISMNKKNWLVSTDTEALLRQIYAYFSIKERRD
eukprot:g36752.t1